ncbi:MAG: hypothetical protein K9N47_22065 [Prosthecobacter sp.]|uniref:hypothetical protein n=1 Tax=Prosthecobacter sp. TaxID=1965333 RepID=UPI00260F02F9|nr:hypothetical protein [Prosthecobacter sp.]MCF7788826.1 hypothetical protein [Prosthecobacter sp.]
MTTSTPANTCKSETLGWVASRPWLWVVLAFVVLLSAWSVLFYIALNNQPEVVPLQHLIPA